MFETSSRCTLSSGLRCMAWLPLCGASFACICDVVERAYMEQVSVRSHAMNKTSATATETRTIHRRCRRGKNRMLHR